MLTRLDPVPLRQTREFVEQLRKSSTFSSAQITSYNDAARDVFFQFSIFKCPTCLRFIRKDQFKDHSVNCSGKTSHLAMLNESTIPGLSFSHVSAYPQVESWRFNSNYNKNDMPFEQKSIQEIEGDLQYKSFKAKCDEINRLEVSHTTNVVSEKVIGLQSITHSQVSALHHQKQESGIPCGKKPQSEALRDLKERIKSPLPQPKKFKVEKKEVSISARDINRSIEPIASKKPSKFEPKKSPLLNRNLNDAQKKPPEFEKVKKQKDISGAKVATKQPDLRFSQKTVGVKGQLTAANVNIRPSQKSFKPVLGQTPIHKPTPAKQAEKPVVTYKIEVDTNFGEINGKTDKKSDRRSSVTAVRTKDSRKIKEYKSPNCFSKTSNTPRSFGEQLRKESKIREGEERHYDIHQFDVSNHPTEPNQSGSELIRIINLKKEELDSINQIDQHQMKKQSSSTRIQQSIPENKSRGEPIESVPSQIPNYEEMRLKYKKNKVTAETREEFADGHEVVQSFNNTESNFAKTKFNMPLAERTGISERVFAITKGSLNSNPITQRDYVESDRFLAAPTGLQAHQAPLDQGFRARSRSRFRPGLMNNQSAVEMPDRFDLNSTLSKVRKSLDELTIENNEWRKGSRERRIGRLANRLNDQQNHPDSSLNNATIANGGVVINQAPNQNLEKHDSPLSQILVLNPKNGSEMTYAQSKLSSPPIDAEHQAVSRTESLAEVAQKTLTRIHRQ